MRSIRQARGAEGRLLALLLAYLQREGRRLGRLARFYDRVRALHREPPASLDNPLLAFGLIKRLHSEWPNVVYSEGAGESTQELQGGFEALQTELPGPEDLAGAARALLRLQDVYALSVRGLAKGAFEGARGPLYRPARPVGLSADDCFHVGKVAYDAGEHQRSIAWLEEAVSLFRLSHGSWNEEDGASLEDALDHLAFSYFMVGNVSHALSLSRELLRYGRARRGRRPVVAAHGHVSHTASPTDPGNARVARNVAQYEKLLEERGPAEPRLRPRARGAYEELCRGARVAPAPPPPDLRCAYHTNGSPWLLLQPAKRETLRLRPFVALYHDFVSDAEAEAIKALAGP
ncbi:P4HA3 hydroxylase, partial [Crypturellus undulatus]|nr:P4HA3 hydroxylase [Crypturellus undulatus]